MAGLYDRPLGGTFPGDDPALPMPDRSGVSASGGGVFQGDAPVPSANPFPDIYNDAEWQGVLRYYDGVIRNGFKTPSEGLNIQPLPGLPSTWFGANGKPLRAPPPQPPPTLRQQFMQGISPDYTRDPRQPSDLQRFWQKHIDPAYRLPNERPRPLIPYPPRGEVMPDQAPFATSDSGPAAAGLSFVPVEHDPFEDSP